MMWSDMDVTYRVILHPDEDGYSVVVPALPGCFSQGATVEDALANAAEAIEVHIAGLRSAGCLIPAGDASPDAEVAVPVTVAV